MPTLVFDDGRSLGESGAIIFHFAEGTEYLPEDSLERARVWQWMFFEQYDKTLSHLWHKAARLGVTFRDYARQGTASQGD